MSTVEFVDGLAFTPSLQAIEARDKAMQDAANYGTGFVMQHNEAFAHVDPKDLLPKPDALIIINRLKRKANVMKLDAPRNSALWYDLEEVLALADLIAAQIGGPDAE